MLHFDVALNTCSINIYKYINRTVSPHQKKKKINTADLLYFIARHFVIVFFFLIWLKESQILKKCLKKKKTWLNETQTETISCRQSDSAELFYFYFTFTDLTIYSKFLSFLTVNTFTKHSYQKLQTVQFVKYTHGSERKHLYWLQQVHTSTTNR